jgi:hypothetical protein
MMNNKPSDSEIVKMFQRYMSSSDSSEIDQLDLEELVAAELRLGIQGINPDFREAIKNQIRKFELKKARKHESKIRALNIFTGLILGLVISGFSAWLFTK